VYGGKWDSTLEDEVRNATTNADLIISINVFFQEINPAGTATGLYNDTDSGTADPTTKAVAPKRRIQAWKPGEFSQFTSKLITEAQKFWSGIFWLRTPHNFKGLDWPDSNPKYRCNVYCKLELSRVLSQNDAHYTIAAVRVPDDETFRSNSVLYSQKDLDSETMISHSTTKFWTHYHEVGHLLGLGHIGWKGHHNLHSDNTAKAYGVTLRDKQDVMGMGSNVHHWHARPWREAVATFTGTKLDAWEVHLRNHIRPTPLHTR
jgi:hypothetical protein